MSAVKIGHASRDERLRASGGKAGDQDGKEVCIRDWYANGWNVLLRPKSSTAAEKMAAFCESVCANNNVGYNQAKRNTLRVQALLSGWNGAAISTPCDTDCSALMTVCAEAAGISVAYTAGNAPTTWTMRTAFGATGAFDVLTDSKYLVSPNYLKRGDILLKESGHTAMALSNGAYAAQSAAAETNEVADGGQTVYTVVPGDTLWGISRKYNTTVAAICAENGISASKYIYPGQKLTLPGKP